MSVLDNRGGVAVREDSADREVDTTLVGPTDRDAAVGAGGDVDARLLVVKRTDERGGNGDLDLLATSHDGFS